jgi:hypothetical protein
MRRIRLIILLLFAGLVLTGYVTLRALGVIGGSSLARAQPVPAGDQEIAFIQAATSGASWERLIAGIRQVQGEMPALQVDDRNAFPEQTAAVPEVSLTFPGCKGRLWIRWYKMTSDAGIREWVAELARRDPPPLAITGGGSSDRGRDLAEALAAQTAWVGKPPLLLHSSATADKISVRDEHGPQALTQPLMGLYPERSFRFCFSDRQMAEAVCDFVWSHGYLWSRDSWLPSLSGALLAAAGDLWGSTGPLAFGAQLQLPDVRILQWADDPYSTDLGDQFSDVLHESVIAGPDSGYQTSEVNSYTLAYSVGDYDRPNPEEKGGINELVAHMVRQRGKRRLLALPAAERPMRRVLRGLTVTAPLEIHDVLAVTGDSLSFNVIYRDRDFAWHIQDMPVPLVFFCHQNPVAWPEQAPEQQPGTARHLPSATDEMLLNADMIRILVEAAFVRDGDSGGPTRLVANADALAERLRQARSADGHTPFFSTDGNRAGGSGEYVVCLLPHIVAGRVLPHATVEVWTRQPAAAGPVRWRLARTLPVHYADAPRGGGGGHGGF